MVGFVWGSFYGNKLFLALVCLQQFSPVTEHPPTTRISGGRMQLSSWSHEGSKCKLQVCKVHRPRENNFLMSTESNCWQLHTAEDMALAEACF